jgi:hypothetical protein
MDNQEARETTGQPYRDYILSVCDRMPINDRQVFDAKLMDAAWPATDRDTDTAAECLRADLCESALRSASYQTNPARLRCIA